jgi:ribosomal protein S1
MKSEGRVPLKEITGRAGMHEAKVGDRIDVYVERLEDRQGEALLSVEKARREAAWNNLEEALVSGVHVNGVIFGRVKGGFAVDLDFPELTNNVIQNGMVTLYMKNGESWTSVPFNYFYSSYQGGYFYSMKVGTFSIDYYESDHNTENPGTQIFRLVIVQPR